MNKRGDTILIETFIFIFLNLIFFAAILVFVWRMGTGIAVYEEVYAKEIAFIIDSAKPGMQISFDMTKVVEIASKSNIGRNEIVSIEGGVVNVKLSSGEGYGMKYFSNYDASASFKDNYITISVREKKS